MLDCDLLQVAGIKKKCCTILIICMALIHTLQIGYGMVNILHMPPLTGTNSGIICMKNRLMLQESH